VLGWYTWYPKAKEKDPKAYDWIIKDRLHEKLNISYKPQKLDKQEENLYNCSWKSQK
jgi:hypothetical protein